MRQRLWVPGPIPSLNELIAAAKGGGGTGRAYSRLKAEWKEKVWALAKSERLQPMVQAWITWNWYETSRRRDPDNFVGAGKKLILDGLVMAKVLPDDGWDELLGFTDHWRWRPAGPGVQVILSSLPPVQVDLEQAAGGAPGEPRARDALT